MQYPQIWALLFLFNFLEDVCVCCPPWVCNSGKLQCKVFLNALAFSFATSNYAILVVKWYPILILYASWFYHFPAAAAKEHQ